MKYLKKFSNLIVALVFALVISACSNDLKDLVKNYLDSNPGEISGKVVFNNVTDGDYSGIVVTLDKTDGLRTVGVSQVAESRSIDSAARAIIASKTASSNGSYSFTNLEPGTYTVYASSSYSNEVAAHRNVVVRASEKISLDPLTLTPTGSISGRILIDDRSPGDEAILVYVAATSWMAMTDKYGFYTISGVPVTNGGETHQVVATVLKYGALKNVKTNVTVEIGKETELGDCSFDSSEFETGGQGEKGDKGEDGEDGKDGKDGLDGVSIEWLGSFDSASEIKNPKYLNAYFNMTDGCSYIYTKNGRWELLARAGKDVVNNESQEEEIIPNPQPGSTKAENLDFIFNNTSLGTTTITIKRSEWNELCDNYRYFYKNENCVHAESYKYEKDGQVWLMKNVGFRLRGNTSRFVPQGIDNGNEQGQMNADWSEDYYAYANKPNDDYRQSHFKVDFEEFLGKDADGNDIEQRMADSMKGVALKRMDNYCGKEIFCYDLFHKNGIWTAPRASHTRLILNIIEDEAGKNNAVTTVDYGVYEMFEEVNKQSLKARENGKNNKADNAWKNNKGNLWKCQDDLTDSSGRRMGVEDIRIVYEGEDIPASGRYTSKTDSTGGKRIGYLWENYGLDLKTNKEEFAIAQTELCNFISELNGLPLATGEEDTTAIAAIKAFYEKWFDVDFFLKTYAVSILTGMDDDYWGNANNYYLYFDTDAKGSGKVYYIPFDYDNTLGASIKDGGFMHNPLDWGRGANRPLMDKLLSVPEYKAKFKKLLLEVASNEYWAAKRCKKIFFDWGSMCDSYMRNADVDYHIGASQFSDWESWQPSGFHLSQEPNIYDATRKSFESWLSGNHLAISQVADSSVQGFKIKIKNIPENAAIREIFVDDRFVANIDRDWSKSDGISPNIMDTDWQYPYTIDGKKYRVKVQYKDSDWKLIETSEVITVTAKDGLGEFSFNDDIDYKIEDNSLVFTKPAALKLNGSSITGGSAIGKFRLELRKTDWDWLSDTELGTTCNSLDLNDEEIIPRNKGVTSTTPLMIRLYYRIPNPYNEADVYICDIIYQDDSKKKNLHLTEDFPSSLYVDETASSVGLTLKIDSTKIPSNAYNRAFYINGIQVSDMGRIYNNGEFPAEHINDTIWNYPYVKAGNKYTVRAEYRNKNWETTTIQGADFVAKSGFGELVANKITLKVEDNKLVFSEAPSVTLNGQKLTKGNFKIEFRKVISEGDNWICDTTFPYGTTQIALNNLFRGKDVDASTQFKVYLYYEIPNDEAGFKYRCQVISEEDSTKANLHLTQDIPEMLTWDSSATTNGLNLKIAASEIPADAYSRELWVNGRYVLEMERRYTDDGQKPAEYIKDTVINYPYVEAGKEYTVYIKYHNGDWKEYRSPEIKVTPTSGLGEISLVNEDSIAYKIEDNHLIFTTAPELKIGNTKIENPFFKFNIDNDSLLGDKWVAGPEEYGPSIDLELGRYIDDGHRPIYTKDQLTFELFYKEYVRDDDDNYKYHYRYQIFEHNDTRADNLHLTSNLLKRQ